MSIDTKPDSPYHDHDDNQTQSQPKRGGSAKYFILGGCGCFTVILLCCGGVAFWGYNLVNSFTSEQIAYAESSPKVLQLLGENVEVDETSVEVIRGGNGDEVEFRYNIEGDDDKGVLVFKGIIKSLNAGFERKEIYLEIGEVKHSLDPDEEFELDIDEGFEEGFDEGNDGTEGESGKEAA